MSWYYDYYIGYLNKADGKIYPYGPYVTVDNKEKLRSILNYSRSFDYDFSECFYPVAPDSFSDELKNSEKFKNYINKEQGYCPIEICYLHELPNDDFVKSGYYLISQVKEYQEDNDSECLFGPVDPITYNGMVDSELKFGKPKPKKDAGGYEYQSESASDYMYFAFPDYSCKEWRAFQIKQAVYAITRYQDRHDNDEMDIVIMMIQG